MLAPELQPVKAIDSDKAKELRKMMSIREVMEPSECQLG